MSEHVRRLFRVEIVSWQSSKVVKRMKPVESLRKAEKIERGANINLNHERYETRVVSCCWFCKERFSRRAVRVPVDGGGPAEFCGDTCVAEFAAKEVKADHG